MGGGDDDVLAHVVDHHNGRIIVEALVVVGAQLVIDGGRHIAVLVKIEQAALLIHRSVVAGLEEGIVGAGNLLVNRGNDFRAVQGDDAAQAVAPHFHVIRAVGHVVVDQVIRQDIALQVKQAVRLVVIPDMLLHLICGQGAAGHEGVLLGGVVENVLVIGAGVLRGGNVIIGEHINPVEAAVQPVNMIGSGLDVQVGALHALTVREDVFIPGQAADADAVVHHIGAGHIILIAVAVLILAHLRISGLQHIGQHPAVVQIQEVCIAHGEHFLTGIVQQSIAVQGFAVADHLGLDVFAILPGIEILIAGGQHIAVGVVKTVAILRTGDIAIGGGADGHVAVQLGHLFDLRISQCRSGKQQHQRHETSENLLHV